MKILFTNESIVKLLIISVIKLYNNYEHQTYGAIFIYNIV